MKTIEMIVSPAGETRIETRGFAGRECLAVTAEFETALGRKTADRLTGEFFQTVHEQSSQRLAAGDSGT